MKEELIAQAVKFILNYTSNIVAQVLPDNPDEKELETMHNTAIVAYAAAKGFGKDIAASTENTYDDKAISELIQSCEEAAKKYNFTLNAEEL